MPIDVDAAVTALNRMTVTQLRHRYGEVFGEPARSFNKQHLVKRIAWRMQANAEGGLTERVRRRGGDSHGDWSSSCRAGRRVTGLATRDWLTAGGGCVSLDGVSGFSPARK